MTPFLLAVGVILLAVLLIVAVATAGDTRWHRRMKELREQTPAHPHHTHVTDEYGRTLP